METSGEHIVRINWVIANKAQLERGQNAEALKTIGPVWGGHATWRTFRTDNVVCHDIVTIKKLMGRALHAVCNFHAPKKYFAELGRPTNMQFYEGDFQHEVSDPEDIISMHLASVNSDIVLMYGFDMAIPSEITNRLEQHKVVNYHGLMRSVISGTPNVQWVLVSPRIKPDPVYSALPNFSCDRMENVLKLLL